MILCLFLCVFCVILCVIGTTLKYVAPFPKCKSWNFAPWASEWISDLRKFYYLTDGVPQSTHWSYSSNEGGGLWRILTENLDFNLYIEMGSWFYKYRYKIDKYKETDCKQLGEEVPEISKVWASHGFFSRSPWKPLICGSSAHIRIFYNIKISI